MSARALHDRVAVVTGGGTGIGLATVDRLLADGARVALWDLEVPDDETLAEAREAGQLLVAAVDVRQADAVADAAAALVATAGRVDILVNNAGTTVGHKPTTELPASVWRALVDTNLTGAFHCVQALVPHMVAGGWGRIVNLTSVIGAFGYPGHAAYVASKTGLAGVTRGWAREFGRSGITVNAVRPGYIRTGMNARNPPEVARQVATMTPLGRLGEASEVAAAIAWLCSDEAAFVTGTEIAVDGGLIT